MSDERLSQQGEQRREQILLLAKQQARRRRGRRVAMRGILAVVPLAVAAMIYSRMRSPAPLARSVTVQSVVANAPSPTIEQPAITVKYVQTDPTITDRLTLPPATPRWKNIGDRELLDELAAAGQPAGIVCLNGKTMLLPR